MKTSRTLSQAGLKKNTRNAVVAHFLDNKWPQLRLQWSHSLSAAPSPVTLKTDPSPLLLAKTRCHLHKWVHLMCTAFDSGRPFDVGTAFLCCSYFLFISSSRRQTLGWQRSSLRAFHSLTVARCSVLPLGGCSSCPTSCQQIVTVKVFISPCFSHLQDSIINIAIYYIIYLSQTMLLLALRTPQIHSLLHVDRNIL